MHAAKPTCEAAAEGLAEATGPEAGSAGARDFAEFGRALGAQSVELKRYAARLVRRGEEVDELVQEAMTRAWRSRASYDEGGSLSGWLKRTVLRALFDMRRRRAAQPVDLGDADRAVPAASCSVEDSSAAREQLARALGPLSPSERALLLAFHGRGESTVEIAARLGQPEGTVRSALHRARRRLAEGDCDED